MVNHPVLFFQENQEQEYGQVEKRFYTPLPESDRKNHSLLSEM